MQYAVVPAFNSAVTIGRVVRSLLPYVTRVVVVDDGSVDDTDVVARSAGAVVVSHKSNRGYAAAILTGVQTALDAGAASFVTFDADGAHIATDVPPLVACLARQEADLVVGSRFQEIDHTLPTQKRDANEFARALVNSALGTTFTDVASGLRCFGKQFAQELLLLEAEGFAFVYEMARHALERGMKIIEYPIGVRYDACGMYKTNHRELLDMVRCIGKWYSGDQQLAFADLEHALTEHRCIGMKVRGEQYWLHPIPGDTAWLIQRQHHPFPIAAPASVIKVDAVASFKPQGLHLANGLHIGLIPDGTRRWARRNGVTIARGYMLAMDILARLLDELYKGGARAISVYLCSRDNLTRRHESEVTAFADAEAQFCDEVVPKLSKQHSLHVVAAGDKCILPRVLANAVNRIDSLATKTKDRRLFLCMGYSPEDEIKRGLESLWVDMPVDLVIRTGGANVLSGFLPVQTANSRLYFLPQLFNDVTEANVLACLEHFRTQHLRYGE